MTRPVIAAFPAPAAPGLLVAPAARADGRWECKETLTQGNSLYIAHNPATIVRRAIALFRRGPRRTCAQVIAGRRSSPARPTRAAPSRCFPCRHKLASGA
jgi:hypothetical protein